jgi:hypothetical protein
MKLRLSILIAALGFLALLQTAPPLQAHHSFAAEFDADKPVTLEGHIVQMKWINPHSWLTIAVKSADGKVVEEEEWEVEFGLPASLYRRGWRKEDLPAGEPVTITGWRAKDGTNTANARTVVLSDGRNLFAGSSTAGQPKQ